MINYNQRAKRANRLIRNLEAKGYTKSRAYLELEYDEKKDRAARFRERAKNYSDEEKQAIDRFLDDKTSTLRGYRLVYIDRTIADRVIDAVNSRMFDENNWIAHLSDKDAADFVAFLHSKEYRSLAQKGGSDEIIEIYLKRNETVTKKQLKKEFNSFLKRKMSLEDVSIKVTGENVFLL